MPSWMLYAFSAVLVFSIGLFGIFTARNTLKRIIAANMMGSGTLLLFVAFARRSPAGDPDPVAHALVLTSIVVSVSATALALALLRRLVEAPADHPPERDHGDTARGRGGR